MTTKSAVKHTPGPWKVEGADWAIVGKREDSELPLCIGQLFLPIDNGESKFNMRSANARLIAVAPELLEALYMALPYVETALEDMGYKPGVVDSKVKQIRSAIDKAEGK